MLKRRWLQVLVVTLCASVVIPVEAEVTPEMLRGEIIVSRWKQKSASLWALGEDGKQQLVMSAPASVSFLGAQFSPSLKQVVFEENIAADTSRDQGFSLVVGDVGGSRRRVLKRFGTDKGIRNVRWSPDGKKLLYTLGRFVHWDSPSGSELRAEVRMLDVASGRDQRIVGDVSKPRSGYEAVAWHRNGKRVMFDTYLGQVGTSLRATQPQRKSCQIDGSRIEPFGSEWGQYLVSGLSADASWRVFQPPVHTTLTSEMKPIFLQSTRGAGRRVNLMSHSMLLGAHWKADSQTFVLQWARDDFKPDGSNAGKIHIDLFQRNGTLKRRLLSDVDVSTDLVAWLP